MVVGLIKFNTWLTKPNPFSIVTLIVCIQNFIKHPLPAIGQFSKPGFYNRHNLNPQLQENW